MSKKNSDEIRLDMHQTYTQKAGAHNRKDNRLGPPVQEINRKTKSQLGKIWIEAWIGRR